MYFGLLGWAMGLWCQWNQLIIDLDEYGERREDKEKRETKMLKVAFVEIFKF
jgi:hypothetical protein